MADSLASINKAIRDNLIVSSKNYSVLSEFGFEQFLSSVYHQIQLGKKYYAISFCVYAFFKNIKRRWLKQKLYSMGISNYEIDELVKNYKGEVSDEIIELFLTEFDRWCDSQWVNNNAVVNYPVSRYYKNGNVDKSNAFRNLRNKSNLKEFYAYRYKTNILILAGNADIINKVKFAVIDWFKHRLNFDIVLKYVDLRMTHIRCCDYNIKVVDKHGKYVIKSSIPVDRIEHFSKELKTFIRKALRFNTPNQYSIYLSKYNKLVFKVHSYYQFATNICLDLSKLNLLLTNLINREIHKSSSNVTKKISSTDHVPDLYKPYLKSDMVRFLRSTSQIILPIGYIRFKKPMFRKKK